MAKENKVPKMVGTVTINAIYSQQGESKMGRAPKQLGQSREKRVVAINGMSRKELARRIIGAEKVLNEGVSTKAAELVEAKESLEKLTEESLKMAEAGMKLKEENAELKEKLEQAEAKLAEMGEPGPKGDDAPPETPNADSGTPPIEE